MLTIITPTGERPQAFELCKLFMQRQTYAGPVYWIIVDDGQKPSDAKFKKRGWKTKVIRPRPFWKSGDNTQARNLIVGLDEAERYAGEIGKPLRLTVWEDDDFYKPEWLERLDAELDKAELVGEGLAHYYNVQARKHKPQHNYKHASLRCTAMRGAALKTFREQLQTFSRYYDFKTWKAHNSKHVFFSDLTIGMKGLPGRPGIADGHDPHNGIDDPKLKKLREWIGDDADMYARFYKEPKMATENKTKKMRALKAFKYGERGLIKSGDVFSLRSDAEEVLFLACGRAVSLEAKPSRSPRTFKVSNQEQRLQSDAVEKTAAADNEEPEQPETEQPADDVSPADGAFSSEEEKPKRFGRRRKSKQSVSEDE